MAILAECPICRKKQSAKNKRCTCGQNMDSAKRSQRVRYWISYRMPDVKQRRESVGAMEGLNGSSIEDEKVAMSKRKVQRKEKRVLDMLPESTITFKQLADWYLELPKIKELASYRSKKGYLDRFNMLFGEKVVADATVDDLEAHQALRKKQGLKPAFIDQEIGHVKSAVNMAFLRWKDKKTKKPLVGGDIVREFKVLDSLLTKGGYARKRTVTFDEHQKLLDVSTGYFRAVLIVGFNTGMRPGELQKLQWKFIDRDRMFIELPEGYTKNKEARSISINHHVKNALNTQQRTIHPFVFTYNGRPLTYKNGFVCQMTDACKKAGLPYGRTKEDGITMHDFRKTVKTNMLAAGILKEYRDMIVGHKLKGMDKHYLVSRKPDLTREMECFTNWVDEQLENANVDQNVDQKIQTKRYQSVKALMLNRLCIQRNIHFNPVR